MRWPADIICLVAGVALMAGTSLTAAEADDRNIRVAVGDVVEISVFDTSAGGDPGNFVTLPSQMVDGNGAILVPHAGYIRVAGRSIPEVQRQIEARLANRAIGPRVVVTLTDQQWT